MRRRIPLSRWASEQGVSRMTAWRLASSGALPGAALSPAGRWVVEVPETGPLRVVSYARVSLHD